MLNIQPSEPRPAIEGEWGMLAEPCRHCHKSPVYFLIDEGPEGKSGLPIMRCPHCKRDWVADSAMA